MGLYGDLAVAAVFALVPIGVFAALAMRRAVLSRSGGMVEMSLRLHGRSHGRGWVLGTGRYVGDELQWFRIFSLAPGPRRRLSRRGFSVLRRRIPTKPEKMTLQLGMIVLECHSAEGPVQLAMGESALTGFLSWLESAAPGASLSR
ncbi:MAG: DUF2550 domain-containing protein [Pseudonocardiales bacterium]